MDTKKLNAVCSWPCHVLQDPEVRHAGPKDVKPDAVGKLGRPSRVAWSDSLNDMVSFLLDKVRLKALHDVCAFSSPAVQDKASDSNHPAHDEKPNKPVVMMV